MKSLAAYSVKRSELFNECKSAYFSYVSEDIYACVLMFLAHVWGWNDGECMNVPDMFRPVLHTLITNLETCLWWVDDPVKFEAIANGMRNCYLCGCDYSEE